MKDRLILHIDMNSFYAQVELLSRPDLKERPVAVGGDEKQRHGVVLAKNDEAKAFGVRTGESLFEARQKCPRLEILPPHHELYHELSRQAREIYLSHTDKVESYGLDECWLDLSHRLPDDSADSWMRTALSEAERMRSEIRQRLHLTVSVGVSWNKTFAKLGSDYRKPDAVTVISRSNYQDIVWPLPAGRLLYVGPVSAKKLEDIGILTIGQLAAADESFLQTILGKAGPGFSNMARGEDTDPVLSVNSQRRLQSVGSSRTLAADLNSYEDTLEPLKELSGEVSRRLEEKNLRGQTVHIWVRSSSFRDKTRQRQLPVPVAAEADIFREAARLMKVNEDFSEPVRALGVTVSSLLEEGEIWQPSLFDWLAEAAVGLSDENPGSMAAAETREPGPSNAGAAAGISCRARQNPAILDALKRLQAKYGSSSVRYGDELARKNEDAKSDQETGAD